MKATASWPSAASAYRATLRPNELLVNASDKNVSVTLREKKGEERTVLVKALANEAALRYRAWVEENRRIVHERTEERVGYLHIPDMGPWGFSEFHRGYLSEFDRKGLIVDVRYNRGGHVSPLLIEKLARKRIGYDAPRYGAPVPYPPESVGGPIVALTNQFAGSDGDIFSHAFKLYKLGPLVGKRTWGGVIGIDPYHHLVDGTLTTQPEFSFWFVDVGWGVENHGTDPDYDVDVRAARLSRRQGSAARARIAVDGRRARTITSSCGRISRRVRRYRCRPWREAGRACSSRWRSLPRPAGAYIASASVEPASWDTAELQGVPYILGISHPTGFPFYVLLGYVWSHACCGRIGCMAHERHERRCNERDGGRSLRHGARVRRERSGRVRCNTLVCVHAERLVARRAGRSPGSRSSVRGIRDLRIYALDARRRQSLVCRCVSRSAASVWPRIRTRCGSCPRFVDRCARSRAAARRCDSSPYRSRCSPVR